MNVANRRGVFEEGRAQVIARRAGKIFEMSCSKIPPERFMNALATGQLKMAEIVETLLEHAPTPA